MNRIRVNQTEPGILNGVPVIIKRRRVSSGIVIWFGNRFLTLARSGVCMFVHAEEWMEWEAYCLHLLYPDGPSVRTGPGKSLSIPKVNGTSLRQLMSREETDLNPLIAAACELRRAHQVQCRYFRAAWSHGDLHLDNILYDRMADRAILIDFDTRHVHLRSKPLPRRKLRVLAALLDFGACANAALDGKTCCKKVYETSRQLLHNAGLSPLIDEYMSRLQELERRRPLPGGDHQTFEDVRMYREAVARLSLETIAVLVLGPECSENGVFLYQDDGELETLFRIVMQCQIILEQPLSGAGGIPGLSRTDPQRLRCPRCMVSAIDGSAVESGRIRELSVPGCPKF